MLTGLADLVSRLTLSPSPVAFFFLSFFLIECLKEVCLAQEDGEPPTIVMTQQ